LDSYNAPHVKAGDLEAAQRIIRHTMSRCILDAVPENQRTLTEMWGTT
jgi:hypothetical protein